MRESDLHAQVNTEAFYSQSTERHVGDIVE